VDEPFGTIRNVPYIHSEDFHGTIRNGSEQL
jgi:hypothetical protein